MRLLKKIIITQKKKFNPATFLYTKLDSRKAEISFASPLSTRTKTRNSAEWKTAHINPHMKNSHISFVYFFIFRIFFFSALISSRWWQHEYEDDEEEKVKKLKIFFFIFMCRVGVFLISNLNFLTHKIFFWIIWILVVHYDYASTTRF